MVGEGFARAITIISIILTVGSLALAFALARRRSRIRPGFDAARAVVGVGAIVVVALLAHTWAPVAATVPAIAAGLGLGFAQGATLSISPGAGGFFARRSPLAMALWGAGILIVQVAGIAARTGLVQAGQAIAWFSACLGIGLMLGRNRPLRRARLGPAGGAALRVLALLLLLPVAFMGTATPAAAQTVQLTDDDICAVLPADRRAEAREPYDFPLSPMDGYSALCTSFGNSRDTALPVDFTVYLFASEDMALARWQEEVDATWAWYAPYLEYTAGIGLPDPSTSYNAGVLDEFGVSGVWFSVGGDEDRVIVRTGRFVLVGAADNLGFDLGEKDASGVRRPIGLIEELIIPMARTVAMLEALPVEPPPGDASTTLPTTTTTWAPGDVSTTTGPAAPGLDRERDEPITPQEAAAQAIAGLIAAAAIGAISWVEAAAGIQEILGGADAGAPPEPPPADTAAAAEAPADQPPAAGRRVDPCAFQQERYEGALGDWQRIQSEIDALRSEYRALQVQIEADRARDLSGAVFDLGMMGKDLLGAELPTPGVFKAMVEAAKQEFGRAVVKQLIQAAAAGQTPDPEAILLGAADGAVGASDLVSGKLPGGAFGEFFTQSITALLAANQSYDYMRFMDTLAAPGAIADPEVLRALEQSSFEMYFERVGPWVGVVTKAIDLYYKNKEWGEGVERRNAMRAELTRIATRIGELEYDLGYAAEARDSYRGFLSRCRQEMG